ncbi:S-adenosyl-L-methionine-dependent methyltransferase [Paramyrothecium foliicola]|nr:S-adenosyl-L-methionine-dependent methyltransferase [Paramyrothecium foliicola]
MNLSNSLAKTQYRELLDAKNTYFMNSDADNLDLFAFLQTEIKSQAAFLGSIRGLSHQQWD